MTDLCQWPHVDFKEPPCVERAVEGSVYCGLHSASVRHMFPMPEASRLTPDILKRIDSDIHGYQTGDWVPDGHAHTTAIMLLEEAARVITALREQLRAYRGAERIAHDEMESR